MTTTRKDLLWKVKELRHLVKNDYKDFQPFSELAKLPTNTAINFNGCRAIKTINTANHIRFQCLIPVGASLALHWHDCVEKIEILSGILRDKLDDTIVAFGGDTIEYPVNKHHVPYNGGATDLELIVDFKK